MDTALAGVTWNGQNMQDETSLEQLAKKLLNTTGTFLLGKMKLMLK
jgi:hypothetical protein